MSNQPNKPHKLATLIGEIKAEQIKQEQAAAARAVTDTPIAPHPEAVAGLPTTGQREAVAGL